MWSYFVAFWASFGFIALRAFQQRNVAFDNYVWIVPTSLLMAATEVYVVANIAARGYHIPLVLTIGAGSGFGFGFGFGALAAAMLHKKFVRKGTHK